MINISLRCGVFSGLTGFLMAIAPWASGGMAYAMDRAVDCIPQIDPGPGGAIKALPEQALLRKIEALDPAYTRVLDANFYYEAKDTPQGIQATSISQYPDLSLQEWNRLTGLYNASIGYSSSSFAVPKSYRDLMGLLKKEGSKLSTDAKLQYLSMLGSRLLSGYDDKQGIWDEQAMEKVFQNLQKGNGTEGGICREIHRFLADAAAALGFERGDFDNVGLHSGLWKQRNSTQAHMVAHFRDAKTGEYYVQNYGQIINTRRKRLDEAVDVSTRILGPLTTASMVESAGKMHLYQPRTARWVGARIENVAEFRDDRSLISVTLGNGERTLEAELGKKTENGAVKGFLVHSEFDASDGRYEMNALGVASTKSVNRELADSVIDEVSLAVDGYAGYLNLQVPKPALAAGAAEKSWAQNSLFLGTRVTGTARINDVTGRLELKANALDITKDGGRSALGASPPMLEVSAGAKYQPGKGPITFEAERKLEMTSRSTTNVLPTLRTAYDKVSVIYDSRGALGGEGKVYVRNELGLYLLEGVGKGDSPIGIRNKLKTVIPKDRRGDFTVFFDGSTIKNRGKDPFYDHMKSAVGGVAWEKTINRATKIGADLTVSTKNRPFYRFEDSGSITPEIETEGGRSSRVMFWMKSSF